MDRQFLPVPEDLAFLQPVNAGQDLDQRRFACAIFPDQPVYLASLHGEIHTFQSINSVKLFSDSLRL
jgi:hypothetical protein